MAANASATQWVPMDPSPVIELRDLSKSYGAVQALSNVDLSISPGEIFGFLGPNGAGKTTTIKILLGFLKPTAGAVRIFGTDPWGDPADVRRRIGFLPDTPGLYQGMSGAALLDYLGRPAVQRLAVTPQGAFRPARAVAGGPAPPDQGLFSRHEAEAGHHPGDGARP